MISVCMGTYNGEKYIEEQLESILGQNLPPDEVILCDDCSEDGTEDVIRQFIRKHGLEGKWKLIINGKNKGYPGNFYYAMSLCRGDLVFLADQDDIWNVRKLERMTDVMEQYPGAKAVCCKFGLVDAEGAGIHSIMAPARTKGTRHVRSVSIHDVFYKCEWPGMVLAYRREWFTPLWEKLNDTTPVRLENGGIGIPHDFLVCALAAEENGFLQLDEELACHRRHDNNAGMEEHRISRLLNKDRKLKEIDDYIHILDGFAGENVLRTAEGKAALDRKTYIMKQRREALASGRTRKVIKSAWENRKSVRLMTVVCDIAISLKDR